MEAPRQAVVLAALGLSLWLPLCLATSCSSPAAPSCPNDYPTSCPDAAPGFAGQIGPLIHTHCTVCHGPGQQVPPLQTYAEIHGAGPRIFNQIHACLMPPPSRAPLTTEDRQAILSWLVCGALDN